MANLARSQSRGMRADRNTVLNQGVKIDTAGKSFDVTVDGKY